MWMYAKGGVGGSWWVVGWGWLAVERGVTGPRGGGGAYVIIERRGNEGR